MRRWWPLGLALAVGAGWVVTGASPAAAGDCLQAITVDEDVEATVQVTVEVRDTAADTVNFEFDESFEITEPVQKPGWEVEQEDAAIRFSGGELAPDTCSVFDVPIKASDAGTFRVRAFQRLDDGPWTEYPPEGDLFNNEDGTQTRVDRNGPPNEVFEQVIHVTPGEDESGSRTPVFVALAIGGVVALALIVLGRPSRGRRVR